MARKILVVVAAILVPGGFIALLGAYLMKLLSQTERGRKVVDLARRNVPAWAASWAPIGPQRQAA